MMNCLYLFLILSFSNSVHSFVPAHVRIGSLPAAVSGSPAAGQQIPSDASSIVESNNDHAPGPSLGAWMPLGSASSLTGLGPTQIRVCGVDLAVWHKPLPKDAKRGAVAKEWSALVDACPHRLAPLSQGRVDPNSGCIECPYHGWSFDLDGSLMKIPQLDEGRTIESATGNRGGATSLPVHAAGDLLFVFLPTEITGESWPISRLPEHHYSYLREEMDRSATYNSRELPYSFDFLIENLSDPAHVHFAHNSLLGKRSTGSPIEMEVTANNFTNFECKYQTIRKQGPTKSEGVGFAGVLAFERPAFFYFVRSDNVTVPLQFYISPIDEGRSRIMQMDPRKKFVPRWLIHGGTNLVYNTDVWLHNAERFARMGASNGLKYTYASKSDTGATLFRKWWQTHGYANAPPNTFGPASASSLSKHALSRAEQIDPWIHHSKNCVICRRALRQMRAMQKVVVVGAATGVIMLQRKPNFAIASVLTGLYVHNFLRKLATTIEGNPNRAEIGDRSFSATH